MLWPAAAELVKTGSRERETVCLSGEVRDTSVQLCEQCFNIFNPLNNFGLFSPSVYISYIIPLITGI